MRSDHPSVDRSRAMEHLLDLLSVEGPSGCEARVAALVRDKLLAAGCKARWIRHDDAHRRIAGDFEVGNLIVRLPGTARGPRRLFASHLDTVPLCRGAVPLCQGKRIVAKGSTALGGDNRTAVACLVTVIEILLRHKLPRPPLTFLFTVGEEIGLLGAREVRPRDLGRPTLGFNIDSGDPRRVVIGAVGADRWEASVSGRSSHAGVHPEDGISAILVASRAIADASRRGYFGKIDKGTKRGTSNVGVIQGGEVTNQVTDHVLVRGESRSHRPSFLKEITRAYRDAFERAARSVKNRQGRTAKVRFHASRDYDAFRLQKNAPVVKTAWRAIDSLGLEPETVVVSGGLDANRLNAKGIPTVTLGAGQHHPHTVDEYVDIDEYLGGCRLALVLAMVAS